MFSDSVVDNTYTLYRGRSSKKNLHANRKTRYFEHAKSWLKVLYDYSIGSCVPAQCTGASKRSKRKENENITAAAVEMDDFMGLIPEREAITVKDRRELEMKDAVKFHFQSHLQKWSKHRKFPWKVIFHLLLVALVTIQVVIFAQDNSKFTRFLIESEEAFDRYFKQTSYNQQPIEKLYTLEDVYSQITLIVNSYYNIRKQAVGSFKHVTEDNVITNVPPNLTMEIVYYNSGCGRDESSSFPYTSSNLIKYTHLFPLNVSDTDLANSSDEICCNTETINSNCSLQYCNCSVEQQIECLINDNLNRINKITFKFTLFTFFRDDIIEDETSVYAIFHVKITLVNNLHSSMIVNIDLDSKLTRYCSDFRKGTTIGDMVIIILLILSSFTYINSFINTYKLSKDLKFHFRENHQTPLHWSAIKALYNKWYIFMLFNHLLLLVAVVLKIISEYKEEISIPLVEGVRVLLGIGIFFLYCGLFGLLSYFESLNELFITIQIAFPRVWRFSICVLVLFIAFSFCGWLVLGPYHPKFQDLSLTMESLYTILNGDDLYTTFQDAHFSSQSYAVNLFSELYLVLFIFIFVYIVLSLFIGIFNQAYESLSGNESRGIIRRWAESNPESNSNSATFASNTGSRQNLPLNTNTKENNITVYNDHPMHSIEHLHSNVSSTFKDTFNFHAHSEVVKTDNVTNSEANDAGVKWGESALHCGKKSEDDNGE